MLQLKGILHYKSSQVQGLALKSRTTFEKWFQLQCQFIGSQNVASFPPWHFPTSRLLLWWPLASIAGVGPDFHRPGWITQGGFFVSPKRQEFDGIPSNSQWNPSKLMGGVFFLQHGAVVQFLHWKHLKHKAFKTTADSRPVWFGSIARHKVKDSCSFQKTAKLPIFRELEINPRELEILARRFISTSCFIHEACVWHTSYTIIHLFFVRNNSMPFCSLPSTVLVLAMEPPPWLFASFPRRPPTEPFATLRRCVLRVDETGAGLDLEITDFGYQARNFKWNQHEII